MPSLTQELVEAVGHLPEGGSLTMPMISGEAYQALVKELAEKHVRVIYGGRLEIMAPRSEHERHVSQ